MFSMSDQIFVMTAVGYALLSLMTAGRVSPITAKRSLETDPPVALTVPLTGPPASMSSVPPPPDPPPPLPLSHVELAGGGHDEGDGGAWHLFVAVLQYQPP
jgi:hypothetical protein